MSSKLPSVQTIRIWGKIHHYFDMPVKRDCMKGFAYAHGRGWRVLEVRQNGLPGIETFECVPKVVQNFGGWEQEVPPKPEPEVKMICGVKIVKDKDGNPICH